MPFQRILASDPVQDTNPNSKQQSKFSTRVKAEKINDLRIIVDISGSMKKTDPHNLRRSAVRLLSGLVPEGSRAGIWNFGKQVNMAVKIGTVDDAWRKSARAESKKISSAGLYTNIESVLRKASFDWKTPNPRFKRNIIILTDGHVDISKDSKLNEASRKRILKEVLPTFERAQVRIHAIALSDDVDEELLTTLSAYTDGLYKKVQNADDLQKLFLQMLEQSIKLDTLPIKDNKFSVDSSINDMTLLVFNKDSSNPTTVITPSNERWTKSKYAGSVKWFSDEGYDLITIKKPERGEWKIQAPTDPNNRVVVATNLKLKLNDIPSYLILGDAVKINAHLEEDGKPLTDTRLLSKFKFVANRDAERTSERQYPLTKSEGDAFSYKVEFAARFKEGNNELIIQAKSPTAQRELRHQFKVYKSLADIKISENIGKYKISIMPQVSIMRPDSIKISVELSDKAKYQLIKHEDRWELDVDAKYKDSTFNIKLDAVGADKKPMSMSFEKTLSIKGNGLKLDLSSKFDTQNKQVEKSEHDTKKEESHASAEKEKVIHEKPKSPQEHKPVEKKADEHSKEEKKSKHDNSASKESEETDWTFVIAAIVIGNLLLAGIVGGGYIFMKRRKEKIAEKLEGELDEDSSKKESNEKK